MSSPFNVYPYLISSRQFPKEIEGLSNEVTRSYIDIANMVNNRTIGIFPTARQAVTGDSWYLNSIKRNQTLRQVYTFTSTASIAHGVTTGAIVSFSRCYGTFTDGTNWYGLVFSGSTAVAGQILFYLTPTNIVFSVGAGAPTLTSGIIVLEWISNN